MKPNFNCEAIANYLQPSTEKLNNIYQWRLKADSLEELKKLIPGFHIDTNQSVFDQNISLRKVLSENLTKHLRNDTEKFTILSKWVIQKWGGINGSENSTDDLIKTLMPSEINQPFNRIASMSKVLSFLNPHQHVIYDARVAYSLNWIILSLNAGEKYFPLPEGRNSRMKAFDICTLIRLKHVELYKVNANNSVDTNFIANSDSGIFIKKNDAYSTLVSVVQAVHNILWKEQPDRQEPYYTEMLLFAIADTSIFKEITDSIELKI